MALMIMAQRMESFMADLIIYNDWLFEEYSFNRFITIENMLCRIRAGFCLRVTVREAGRLLSVSPLLVP